MTTTQPQQEQREWLSCAETAKFVRKALKEHFPKQKFSVRSETYAGGASINVRWTNGVPESDVRAVVNQFKGADFDGMVDMKTYRNHWLLPDGTVQLAKRAGSYSYDEEVYEKPHPDAKKVSFGADFIFCERTIDEATKEQLARAVATKLNLPYDGLESKPYENGMERWYDLLWKVSKTLDLTDFTGNNLHLRPEDPDNYETLFERFEVAK